MKRKIITILLLCIAYGTLVKAENTDVSTIDNVIYVESASVNIGERAFLSICMKNIAPIRGFQFSLYLPEGVTAAKNSKGRIQASLSLGRLDEGDEHTLSVSEQEDGCLLFLCGSQYAENFTGNEGEIATLSINIDKYIIPDNYPITLKNVKLTETDISKWYEKDEVLSTLTISPSVDTRTVLDETSTVAPEAATGVDVRVKRTIKASEWSTLCLPFAMTEAQVKEAFGEDVQLADFAGYETEEDEDGNIPTITVTFNDLTAIEANHPCLIKVSAAISEFTVDGVDIDLEEEPVVATVKRTRKQWSELVGTYVANTEVPEKTLFLNGNKFWYSTGATRMKAFRAYFDFYDVLTEVDEAYAKVRFIVNGESTNIEGIASEGYAPDDKVYSVSGMYMGTADKLESLPAGLYVVNGKKVMVK